MSSFKDQLKADIKNVFFNTSEFADMHDIDGKLIPAIIDDEIMEEYENLKDYNYDGMYKVKLIVFVSLDSLEKIPVAESSLKVDGRKYFVLGTSKPDGMLKLILGVSTS